MKQLHRRAIWLFFIKLVSRWAIIIVFGGFYFYFRYFLRKEGLSDVSDAVFSSAPWYIAWGWLLPVLLIVFLYVWARLQYRFYKYELRDDGFRKELGVIYKRYVTIPYGRIQNIDIYRGLLDRVLGLSDLHIQTAGMSGVASTEGRLPGLGPQEAELLRDEILQRAGGGNKQGL
jgi:uncharacterized protein